MRSIEQIMRPSQPVAAFTSVNSDAECSTTLSDTAQALLKFRLYEDDEGIWACCDWCHNWRYVEEQKDPAALVNEEFLCKHVRKTCNVDVDGTADEVFFEAEFCAGSLVWAKRPDAGKEKDWLWWPALVEDSLDAVSQYFLLDDSSSKPIAYHVTFLDAYRTGGWVRSDLLKPFNARSKTLDKISTSRAGKKQRLLREAVERAKNAAQYSVVQRLENFSYIAHMARLKGLIRPSTQTADKILNGTNEGTKSLHGAGSPEKDAVSQRKKGRAKKRKPEKIEEEIPANEAPANHGGSSASPPRKTESELHDEILEETDPTMNVDSGYAVNGDSPVKRRVQNTRKRKAEDADAELSELGSLESPPSDEGSASSGTSPRSVKIKKRAVVKSAKKKRTPSPNSGTAPVIKATKRKNVPQEESLSMNSASTGAPESTAPKRRKTMPRKSKTEASSEADASAQKNPDSISDSQSSGIVADSGTGSFDDFTPTSDSQPFAAEIALEKNRSKQKALPRSTPGLPKKNLEEPQEIREDENEPPEAPAMALTQPILKKTAPKPVKKAEAPRRRETAKVKDRSFSMSQPLPSRTRSKFAPPTRAKPKDGNYALDDFRRDLVEGVL